MVSIVGLVALAFVILLHLHSFDVLQYGLYYVQCVNHATFAE